MRWLLTIILLTASPTWAARPDDALCEAVAIAKESKGESLQGSRAVLSVLRNRMRILDKTACEVVAQRGQFSWYKRNMKWAISEKQWTRYLKVATMPRLLPHNVFFFHSGTRKVKLGKYYTTVGNHKFYTLIKRK